MSCYLHLILPHPRNLRAAEIQINGLSDDLRDVDETVRVLRENLEINLAEAGRIELGLNQAMNTLTAAEGLVGKLVHEFTRWNEQVRDVLNCTNKA